MSAYPRCAALLRNGTECGRTVAAGSEFCVHHTKLLATTDAETMRHGRTPKSRAVKKQALRLVAESTDEDVMTMRPTTVTDTSNATKGATFTDARKGMKMTTIPDEKKAMMKTTDSKGDPTTATVTVVTSANADPATVRPSFATAAAENVDQLTASLLEAAGSAVKPVWLTVECAACGERARIEAPIPDVRSRVAAIELLLREGLGGRRPPRRFRHPGCLRVPPR